MDGQEAILQLQRLEAAISRVTRVLVARGGGEIGLSPSQRVILRALAGGPLRVSEVAAQLGVTLSAATGLVDRMTKSGLVTRDRDRGDRRVVWVNLTSEGKRVLEATERQRLEIVKQVVEPLSPAEVAQLCATLERLQVDV